MTVSSNLFVSFVGGPYQTPLWFDANNVGNYIGKVSGFPAVVGNNAAFLVGGLTSLLVSNNNLTIANTTANTNIPIPTSGQHSSSAYFLNANGSWTIPPNPVNNTTGFTGDQQLVYYDGVSPSLTVYATLHFANGLCTGIT